MRGTLTVPFTQLFADTVQHFGVAWARAHYLKRGMTSFEFGCWLGSLQVRP